MLPLETLSLGLWVIAVDPASIHARWSKSSQKHSIRFCGIFPSLNLLLHIVLLKSRLHFWNSPAVTIRF